jgi:hypothetical protein
MSVDFLCFSILLILSSIYLPVTEAFASPHYRLDAGGISSEQASFAYGESCLLGSPGSYSSQNLWAGKKAKQQRLSDGLMMDPDSLLLATPFVPSTSGGGPRNKPPSFPNVSGSLNTHKP